MLCNILKNLIQINYVSFEIELQYSTVHKNNKCKDGPQSMNILLCNKKIKIKY